MTKCIYLHIGTHKTGSTSIQRFLSDHEEYIARNGLALYRGAFQEFNHSELHLAAMRYERDSFAKLSICKHLTFDASFTRQMAERVKSFIISCSDRSLIFTSEALSWLRHDDEIHRLRTVLGDDHIRVKVVLYLRNKEDYLRSYTNQIFKVKGRKPSNNYSSVLYVEPDTWLTDYETLIDVYQRGFGAENLAVLDYDAEMRRVANVIPSFLSELGLDSTDDLDINTYFLNTTNPVNQREPQRGIKRWFERTKRVLLQRGRGRAA